MNSNTVTNITAEDIKTNTKKMVKRTTKKSQVEKVQEAADELSKKTRAIHAVRDMIKNVQDKPQKVRKPTSKSNVVKVRKIMTNHINNTINEVKNMLNMLKNFKKNMKTEEKLLETIKTYEGMFSYTNKYLTRPPVDSKLTVDEFLDMQPEPIRCKMTDSERHEFITDFTKKNQESYDAFVNEYFSNNGENKNM